MDLLIKHIKKGILLFLSLGITLLSQPASAQFQHHWQTEIVVGTAVTSQKEYYIKQGYPDISIVGNLGIGLHVQGQLLRNLNSWSSAGAGIAQTQFSSLKIPDRNQQTTVDFKTTALNLSGRIYPIGKDHRFTPFLQAGITYSQVTVAHGEYVFSADSLSRHSGNPDYPVLLRIDYAKPAASQASSVLGASATSGAELLLNDVVGLTWQVSYKLHKTGQMELIGEDFTCWDYSFGLFFRMFKTKRVY